MGSLTFELKYINLLFTKLVDLSSIWMVEKEQYCSILPYYTSWFAQTFTRGQGAVWVSLNLDLYKCIVKQLFLLNVLKIKFGHI